MNKRLGFLIAAIILFILGAVFAFVTGEEKWMEPLALFAGLASFAASFLP